MLKDVSIGRYYQGNSILHKTDPRIKVILFVVYMVTVFFITKIPTVAALLLSTIVIIIMGRLPLKVVWNSVKPILPIAFFIFAINALTIKEGNALWKLWKFTITDEGLMKAFLMSFRLLMLILITSILLTLTTTPLKLSDALEKLFSPLKVFKAPVHEMAMMMSIALRFIPTLTDETDKIMKAQVSRGADYDTGSILNRLKGYITVLIPLFISSFRRAEELAIAMEARCYSGGTGRTKLNPLKITGKDILVLVFLTILAASIIAVEKLI